MSYHGSGLTDKLYWRRVGGCFHCLSRAKVRGIWMYVSLCGKRALLRSGGQKSNRPPIGWRCSFCDSEEIVRRGWEESGPVTMKKKK